MLVSLSASVSTCLLLFAGLSHSVLQLPQSPETLGVTITLHTMKAKPTPYADPSRQQPAAPGMLGKPSPIQTTFQAQRVALPPVQLPSSFLCSHTHIHRGPNAHVATPNVPALLCVILPCSVYPSDVILTLSSSNLKLPAQFLLSNSAFLVLQPLLQKS